MAQQTAGQNGSQALLIKTLLAGVLTALILSIIVLSCVPPVSRDALTHHLTIPKLYLQHGGMYEIPSLVFSYYPMNLDLLYLIPLYFGNDIVPKFIHFSFALLTAWLIFDYIKKRIDAIYGLLAAFLFLSIPVIIKLSITVYVDLGLVFFSFASIFYIFKWLEHGFKQRYLLTAGLFCGLALGTKYNGLVVFFLLTLFIPFVYSRTVRSQDENLSAPIYESRKSSFFQTSRHSILFVITALFVFSPWMIRNYRWTGNPIYPLYDSFFSAKAPAPVSSETGGRSISHFAVRKLVYKETPAATISIPVRIFFQGQDDNPKYFDGKLNPYLFILPFLAFMGISKNTSLIKREKKFLLAFAALYLLYVYFSRDMRIRYIAPIIPPLVILSVYGLHELVQRTSGLRPQLWRRILLGSALLAVGGLLMLNARYIILQFHTVNPLPFIFGEIDRDTYIQHYRPEYQAIRYINHNLPRHAKILGFFIGNRSYYCDRSIIFYPHGFRKFPDGDAAVVKILNGPQRYGITHLLIRDDLFKNWLNRFPEGERKRLMMIFKKKTRLLYSKDGYGVFALNDDS